MKRQQIQIQFKHKYSNKEYSGINYKLECSTIYIFNLHNTQQMAQKAAGSIWNPNSWHWQMKNYTDLSKKMLQEKFKNNIHLVNDKIVIENTKIIFSKAQAQVNVRKGKQVLLYDFEIQIDVNCHNEEEESKGSYKIKEILSDDLNDMIIEDIKATQKNKMGDQLKKWVKKSAKEAVIKIFKQFETEIMKIESDPNKLQQDKKKRQQAQQAMQKAKQQKGLEKERLLQEQRQKQKKMKQEAYRKNFEKKSQ